MTTDKQKPYRMEYCEGCPVPDCDFYDAECSRQWVDKLLAQERERCAGRCELVASKYEDGSLARTAARNCVALVRHGGEASD